MVVASAVVSLLKQQRTHRFSVSTDFDPFHQETLRVEFAALEKTDCSIQIVKRFSTRKRRRWSSDGRSRSLRSMSNIGREAVVLRDGDTRIAGTVSERGVVETAGGGGMGGVGDGVR